MKEYTEATEENIKTSSRRREDYFRCKVCKLLWEDSKCIQDPIRGYLCPNGCEKPFEQEDYELPTDS